MLPLLLILTPTDDENLAITYNYCNILLLYRM